MTSARVPAHPYSWLSASRIVYACCLAIMLLSGILIIRNVTLWYDEAMYYVNIRDASWRELLLGLPFYDQAAPFGYSAVLKIIQSLFGMNEILLRLPSLAGLACIAIVASRLPGLSALERALFCILLVSSSVVFEYSTYMKHYVWEFFFMILVVSQNIPESLVYRRPILRTFCLLVATVFSFQLVIVIAAVGLTAALREAKSILAMRAIAGDAGQGAPASTRKRLRDSSIVLLPLILISVVEVAKYVLVTRGASAIILTNYRYAVDFGYIDQQGMFEFYAVQMLGIFWYHFVEVPMSIVVFLASLVLGIAMAVYRRRGVSIGFFLLLAVVITLNAIGFYPLLPGRFTVLLVLPFAFFMALGMAEVVERLGRRGRIVAVSAVAMLCTIGPVLVAMRPPGQHARQLLAAARSQLDATPAPSGIVLLTIGSEPLLDAYFGPFGDRSACMMSPARILGWTNRCAVLRQPGKDKGFAGSDTPWFIMNDIGHVMFGLPVRHVDASVVEHWTADYVDFLFRQVCAVPDAIVLVSHLRRSFTQQLQDRFAHAGTLRIEVDETRRTDGKSGDGIVLRWHRTKDGNEGCDR